MRDGFVRVAAATPKIKVADPEYNRKEIVKLMLEGRIFDSSLFALVQETLYLSHFRLIFLSNLCLLYCVLYRTVL